MTTPLLQIVDVTAGFGATTVLHGVSLEVPEGSIAGIFGLNGAGKSVTLKTVAGIVPARTGMVLLDTRVQVLPMEALGADLGDAYVLVREAWTQRRMHEIDDQNADAAGDPEHGYSCLASKSKHCRPRP